MALVQHVSAVRVLAVGFLLLHAQLKRLGEVPSDLFASTHFESDTIGADYKVTSQVSAALRATKQACARSCSWAGTLAGPRLCT